MDFMNPNTIYFMNLGLSPEAKKYVVFKVYSYKKTGCLTKIQTTLVPVYQNMDIIPFIRLLLKLQRLKQNPIVEV